jgi:GNAT superfamily N-acetyltransferase
MSVIIESLNKRHERDNFDCGEESLNIFLRQYARQNNERGFGRTFVAVESGRTEVLGYYTLSSGSVSFSVIAEKVPRYPIPVAHLGRLATGKKAQGRGLGELLLIDALARCVAAANELGIYAVELYALTDKAKSFYLRYGFVPLQDDELHLYLPIETLRKSGLI